MFNIIKLYPTKKNKTTLNMFNIIYIPTFIYIYIYVRFEASRRSHETTSVLKFRARARLFVYKKIC